MAAAKNKAAKKSESQASLLMKAAKGIELFHDPDGNGFATLPVGNHVETYSIKSKGFRSWFSQLYFNASGRIATETAMKEVLRTLEGRAIFNGPEHQVFVRVGEYDGDIFLDLGDEEWRAVQITATGWKVVENPPIKFRRPRGLQALPAPERGGSIDELRRFVNLNSDRDFKLLVGFLVCCLRACGPYFVLIVQGEHGSAKSFMFRIIRSQIDPNNAPLRAEQRDIRDLMIASKNGWLIPLDNLSRIPNWLSDSLCRLSTGCGFTTRELYSDDEEAIFDSARPVLVNSIEPLAIRSDLLDRAIILTLPVIPEDHRQSERELWNEYHKAMPRILGSLLDGVSAALANIGQVKLLLAPRMADCCEWMVGAEIALGWDSGSFLAAYSQNRMVGHESALDASVVAPVFLAWWSTIEEASWCATATELLDELNVQAGHEADGDGPAKRRPKGWPGAPHILSGHLRRLAPDLREAFHIEMDFDHRTIDSDRQRLIKITQTSRSDGRADACVTAPKEAENTRPDASTALDASIGHLQFPLSKQEPGREVYSI